MECLLRTTALHPRLVPADAAFSEFSQTIINSKYAWTKPSGFKESWPEIAHRVVQAVCAPYLPPATCEKIESLIVARKFMPGGRYLYASGRKYHQVNNCFLLRAHDSRQGWANLSNRSVNCLMSGGGIGVDYTPVREEGALVQGLGGFCTGPLSLMQMQNESGRHIMQGGSRRSAIWAGLNWLHKDIFKFIHMKDWPLWLRLKKQEDFNVPAPMDMTNISVGLNDQFFQAYHDPSHVHHSHAHKVYWTTVRHMLESAEPGFSVDCGSNLLETLRNACTEVSSADDDDCCNLASLVLPRFHSRDEFEEAVDLGIQFLLCGSQYSDLPYPEVARVREKNRRLGLGIMGFHEWLLRRGKSYGPDHELGEWLAAYETSTAKAHVYCDRWSISRSLKTRALAPNGTIGIAAETTSSIEPIFAVAMLRRYLAGKVWHEQYVIDAAASRLIADGVEPTSIEQAYDLPHEQRIAFQAWVQQYVDHGISSTVNLPAWGSALNNESTVKAFGNMLIQYLPSVRGMTCYPDGARGGQPLTVVPYSEAVHRVGRVSVCNQQVDETLKVEEYTNEVACPGGACGV